MSHRVGQVLSAVFVAGFLGWVVVSTRSPREVARTTEEGPGAGAPDTVTSPCAVPVKWFVADVDPRFDVSREWVAGAAREAAGIWGLWEGRPLLEERPGEGIPIRMAYDDRQRRMEERIRREDGLLALDDSLRLRAKELSRQQEAYHDLRLREGGAGPPGPDSLQAMVEGLEAQASALDSLRAARDAAWDVLRRDFPTDRFEAAVFRASESPTSSVAHREIRVFTFRDRNELVWTLAHEFGHALGVPHTEDGAGLMGGEQSRVDGLPAELVLTAADRLVLNRRCATGDDPSLPR